MYVVMPLTELFEKFKLLIWHVVLHSIDYTNTKNENKYFYSDISEIPLI